MAEENENALVKGIRTSEFWFAVAAFMLSALLGSGVIPVDSVADKLIMVVGSILSSMGYAVSRGLAKAKK